MKKEDLIKMGIDEELAKQIMALHGTDVTGLNAIIKDQKSQLETRDRDITNLQAQHKELTEQSEARVMAVQRDAAIELALAGDKARNPKLAKAALNMEKITLDEGKITGYEEQIKALKESDPYLFEAASKPGGYNPRGGSSTKSYETFEEALEADDLQAYFKQQKENGGSE